MPSPIHRKVPAVHRYPTHNTQPFEYSRLPASLQREVQEQAEAVRGLLAMTARNVVQIGIRLQFVRDRIGRENFQPWLRTEFQWSQSVASNYMRAAKTFSETDCIDQFQPSALYLLSRKRCPPAALKEALTRAKHGERITKTLANDLVTVSTVNVRPRHRTAERVRRYVKNALGDLLPAQVEELAAELTRLADELRQR